MPQSRFDNLQKWDNLRGRVRQGCNLDHHGCLHDPLRYYFYAFHSPGYNFFSHCKYLLLQKKNPKRTPTSQTNQRKRQ